MAGGAERGGECGLGGVDGVAGARREFLGFYDSCFHRVVAFVMHARGSCLADAQDAAQDAFVEAWRISNEPGGWQRIVDPQAWIRTVALRRLARPSGVRRQPPTVSGADELLAGIQETAPGPAELAGEALDVLSALRALDSRSRTVMAFHLDGFSSVVIAGQLGIDDQQVRNLLKKARTRLARDLARHRSQDGGSPQ